MTCSDFRRSYSDFADGVLDERAEVSSHGHLAECPGCRRFHLALQRGLGALRRHPSVRPSLDFARRLEQRLQREALDSTPFPPGVRHWSSTAAAFLIMTALALFSIEATQNSRAHRAGATGALAPLLSPAMADSLPSQPLPVPSAWHLNASLTR